MDASTARFNANTRRLRVLLDFLTSDYHVTDPENIDPDVVSAHNLAVEAVLKAVRQLATESCTSFLNSSPSDSSRDCEASLSQAAPDGHVPDE